LLEGSCRLASWSGDADGAIWASTMAPREVLTERLEDPSLIGHELSDLLRWEWNESERKLAWLQAA